MVPVRAAPEFADAVKLTVPGPLPVAPPVTESQVWPLVAVHAHPDPVFTPVVLEPPVAAIDRPVGDKAKLQPDAAWLTVNVFPAIVNVPVLGEVVVFAAMVNELDPAPLPLAPLVRVIHAALLAAVHAQPVGAVTLVEPVPAAALTD